jgi:hypothetical protein
MEALSDMISLVGVPGRSSLDIDARLGWRDVVMLGGNIEAAEEGVALGVAGASALGVGAILNVFGVFRGKDDWAVADFRGGNSDAATTGLSGVSGVPAVGAFEVCFWVTAMFKIPGVDRLSLDLAAV